MKIKQLRNQNQSELAALIVTKQASIAQAHVDIRTSQLKNIRQIRQDRRTIAQVKTILNEAKIAEEIQGDKK